MIFTKAFNKIRQGDEMKISIEDIKYLERFANEKPCGGKVWKMANEGKTYYEIAVEVGGIIDGKKVD